MRDNSFKAAVPILFVRDVAASSRFYSDRLGFVVDFLYGTPPFYGSVSRGQACLHLRHVGSPNFAALAATEPSLILASIEVSDVHGLYEEFQAQAVDVVQRPTRQEWGGTDLHVRDPDGNVISFVTYA